MPDRQNVLLLESDEPVGRLMRGSRARPSPAACGRSAIRAAASSRHGRQPRTARAGFVGHRCSVLFPGDRQGLLPRPCRPKEPSPSAQCWPSFLARSNTPMTPVASPGSRSTASSRATLSSRSACGLAHRSSPTVSDCPRAAMVGRAARAKQAISALNAHGSGDAARPGARETARHRDPPRRWCVRAAASAARPKARPDGCSGAAARFRKPRESRPFLLT